ncbi:hypothetical protein B0T21DRAFT_387333 [Apiosordaria backusii]|uniref:Uncharacterized protein n=1 Tax=Apiosordaria backusii TaxID=314023 RepID=A0AA40A6T7_9PEZI|nr:hypothetical protein B0T21DRAFT_387333 [Apiosordaria backusii]
MDKSIDSFIPPYLISFPTGKIDFCYVGPQAEWQCPARIALFRRANSGHLSIYCDLEKEHSHVILAVCFEEDDLPSLHRQVYYHYLDNDDTIAVSGDLIEISFQNYPEHHDGTDAYKNSIAWRIHFSKKHLSTVRCILTQVRPLTANVPRISALSKEDRELLYYDIRATLMPQPIPYRLGAVGKWQNRIPAGCPRFPSTVSDTYDLISHQDPQDKAQVGEDLGSITPVAIKEREKERERNKNRLPTPPRNKNDPPTPPHEDEGYYETIDATPEWWNKPKPEPPTPTPVRSRRTTDHDAFADSPVGNPGKMAIRKNDRSVTVAKNGRLDTAANNDRKVSILGMQNNRPITMEFDPQYTETVL